MQLIAFETAPRLLICIDPEAEFSPQDLVEKTNTAYVKTDQDNPYKTLLPICLDHPQVAITYSDPSFFSKKIRRIAHRCGYRYIYFVNESLDEAISKTLSAISNTPTLSSQIYHLSEHDSKRLYELQNNIDTAFTNANINYWAGRGTLLGAVRHKGIMPWEDYLTLHILDADENKLKSLEEALDQAGLSLYYNKDRDFYKIFPKDGDVIQDLANQDEVLPFRYPVADLFVMSLECRHEAEDIYVHRSWFHYWHWNTENFSSEQIKGCLRAPFGKYTIPIPANPERTLNQIYGMPKCPDLWKTHAIEPFWDHKIESDYTWPGFALVEIDDFSMAPMGPFAPRGALPSGPGLLPQALVKVWGGNQGPGVSLEIQLKIIKKIGNTPKCSCLKYFF